MLQRVLQLVQLCAIVPTFVQAQAYTFTTLDYPGATVTAPNAINSAGVVTGSYVDRASTTHGFVYFNGTFVAFDVPNAKFTALTGINKHGVICGNFANTSTHGFVWEKGQFTQVDFPGATSTSVNGIADTGPWADPMWILKTICTASCATARTGTNPKSSFAFMTAMGIVDEHADDALVIDCGSLSFASAKDQQRCSAMTGTLAPS